jgi:cobalt/nickel transport system ATP-binding protein
VGSEILAFDQVDFSYPGGQRLARRFPAFRAEAIRDLSFSLQAGVATVLLGDNGSGKSTVLQLCNGLLRPDRGEIRWKGRPLDRSRAGLAHLRAEVGLVFQDPDDQLFAGSVLDDVAFGPRNLGLSASEAVQQARRALEVVGMADLADLPPHVLSHGLRKRAALAGVLAIRPNLLLLDEPTAGLDADSTDRVVAVLAALVGEGTTLLVSTHDLEVARRLAGQAILLSKGRLLAQGDFDAVCAAFAGSRALRGRAGEPGSALAFGGLP